LKASLLALTLVISSLPALADELQVQTQPEYPPELAIGGPTLSEPELGQPGSFRWTAIEPRARRAQGDALPPPLDDKLKRTLMFTADTPTATIEAKLREVAAQIIDDARRSGVVDSLRLRIRVRCVAEDRVLQRNPNDASIPAIWTSLAGAGAPVTQTVEMCAVSVDQAVRMREKSTAKMTPYSVSISSGTEASK
jgi:hypothetical protein